LHDFHEQGADRGAKNSLLAGKPDRRLWTKSEMISCRTGRGTALGERAAASVLESGLSPFTDGAARQPLANSGREPQIILL
jgi:hypothetical protein